MSDEAEYVGHPSFGVINITKDVRSSQTLSLFGSTIPHNTFLQVSIHHAKIKRDLSNDWIVEDDDDKGPIVEFYMSPTQFAEAITSPNEGEGTPITIAQIGNKRMPTPPSVNKRVQFDEEFEEHMIELADRNNKFLKAISEILAKPNIGKKDREEIMKQLDFLRAQIVSNIPFIKEEFTDQMDNTVVEAKDEFDAYLDNRLKSLGLQGFKKELAEMREKNLMLENKGESK